MDNITDIKTSSQQNSTHSILITLDTSQFFMYQTSHIELRGPDGRHLEFVGRSIQQDREENNVYRLREQIYLVSCLLDNINNDAVNVPTAAMSGLADLFCQMQKICDKNL